MEFTSKPLRLDWGKELPKYYVDNNVFKTHFFNALSITFPTGENFFVESVKAVRDKVDDNKLLQDIDTFIKQENWHSYTHDQFNIWLSKQGIPFKHLEDRFFKQLNFIKQPLTNKQKLTTTVCIEHMSTLITVYLLTYPEILNSMDPHFQQVWIWHSIEEIEHKSVAMDALNATCTFTMNLRRLNMIFTTCIATWVIFSTVWSLLKADKQLWKWQTFKDATSFMFNKKNGFIRKSFKPWFNFMTYNFHPKNHDHTDLLRKYSK
jgi:predicted metal-dependent hydrolase